MAREVVSVNRAPVLTLWAGIVAERLGYDREESLSLGKALAGLNAQSKGRHLGIYKPAERPEGVPARKKRLGEAFWVELLGRPIPAIATEHGIRAVAGDRPVEPAGVERYLEGKFGEALQAVRRVMEELARSFDPDELAPQAFSLYERFRPEIPSGVRGWGAKGELDLDRIRELAKAT
ncbi:MAG: hypothetical protein WBC70_14755 [Candidatus Aminicenantales bacterium]